MLQSRFRLLRQPRQQQTRQQRDRSRLVQRELKQKTWQQLLVRDSFFLHLVGWVPLRRCPRLVSTWLSHWVTVFLSLLGRAMPSQVLSHLPLALKWAALCSPQSNSHADLKGCYINLCNEQTIIICHLRQHTFLVPLTSYLHHPILGV